MTKLTTSLASRFAQIALSHIGREWPNKLDHVMSEPADVRSPRELHPVFYGSFDWHSCVHGYWLLAQLYRRFPEMPECGRIRDWFATHLSQEKVAGEITYLERPSSRGFERPYGWAWGLMLSGELAKHESEEGRAWSRAMRPLANVFVARFRGFLPLATYPVRAGAHGNTAFALRLALDYAARTKDQEFAVQCREKALAWYAHDKDCQAWEPSQDDFLSPALMEAACMAAALPRERFAPWFSAFLPRAALGEPATLFTVPTVSDRTDGKIAHLDGLSLSRAWCWRIIRDCLDDARLASPIDATIEAHLSSALDHVAGDYMGEHWLATFALLALGDNDSAKSAGT